jgi:hypothetical protein
LSSPPVKTLKKLGTLYKASTEEIYEIVLAVSIEEVTHSLHSKFFNTSKKGKRRAS